jgi:Ni/Fe-hydrogenase subunit HybB-like protein/Fe-S-cluster-containing dehydrogenase component
MGISRRDLLKGAAVAGVAGATTALAADAHARAAVPSRPDALGMLYDATLCIGCRACVRKCREVNQLPAAPTAGPDMPTDLSSSTKNIIKEYQQGDKRAFIKQQCMHCIDPSCVSVCMIGALHKEGEGKRRIKGEVKGTGIVKWDPLTCVGCRYCQMACAFNVPKFGWNEALPSINKCELCRHRGDSSKTGALALANPGCCEICPREAVIFGKRAELMAEAKRRMAEHPGRYSAEIYGENEGGGTQVLYLLPAGIDGQDVGFPDLPERSSADFSETASHAPYLHGITPVAMYAALAFTIRKNKKREEERAEQQEAPAAHGHQHARPIGGRMFDRLMITLLALFGLAGLVMLYRFVFGVGPVSNMTDGFTWGIWEPINVVVFTGIGAGAYGVGILCYVLNRGKYHSLVRPACLLGAIAYTLGGGSIMVAIGRYWNSVFLPVVPWWNLSSALLEVAICVITYVFVLWVEVLPSVFTGLSGSAIPFWARIGRTWGPRLDRVMPFIIALAIVLPTMHQSSLGGLMLICGPKLHPLWHTALLPTLFLISCLSMGFGALVVLTTILHLHWDTPADRKLFADMSRVNAGLVFLYVVVRLADIVVQGKLHFLGANLPTFFFGLELSLYIVPAVMFLLPRVQGNHGRLFGAALLTVAAGALYRIDAYLTLYRPAGWLPDGSPREAGWDYFPSLGEITVTVGMAAVGMAIFVFVCRKFPVVATGQGPRSQASP